MALLTPPVPGLFAFGNTPQGRVELVVIAYPPVGSDGITYIEAQVFAGGRYRHIRGAEAVPLAPGGGVTFLSDSEAPHGARRTYRVRAVQYDEVTETSAPSDWATIQGIVFFDSWWLKCPELPSLNVRLHVDWADISEGTKKDREFVWPMGRETPIVDQGVTHSDTLQVPIVVHTIQDRDRVKQMYRTDEVLLLQDDLGEQWYVVMEGELQFARQPIAGDAPVRTATLSFVEVV